MEAKRETGLRGRSLRGTRLIARVPTHDHWKTTTFVAGLRAEGWVAPTVIDGAINCDLFVAHVEQQLCPALRPGDTVVLDDLSSHNRAEAREKIENAGAEMLFLRPYSPDLNPIEQAFAKLKALLRRSGRRTMESLWNYCGKVLDEFTQDDIDYIRHSGCRCA
ncbi:transposase [Rubinisphaera sp. ICM_H10]|uniref:transposase n=1 Tax=Rubinisphaera margarita TaxID=2909586 RepID=UPI001EE941D7|nr:transposase [Rubinisphaera margarita]MCG6154178.1 transposase [Rubinisphaera margarita]